MGKSLEPIVLKNISLKNRIVRSATNSRLGNLDGSISDADIAMFKELAENNVGLLITGHSYVSPFGKGNLSQTSICDDTCIPKLTELVTQVKQFNCKIVAQISHAGAQSYVIEQPVAPSNIELQKGHPARELTLVELSQIEQDFINAAYRVKVAGFDGVQVQAAHNSLLCEFITPAFNLRTDDYGGSQEGRFLIIKEILKSIKEKCGSDFPVFVKIDINVETDHEKYFNNLVSIMNEFKLLGVEAVEISGYNFTSKGMEDHNYYLEEASELRKLVDLPIIVVGGVRNFDDMDEMLHKGIDMVSLCRPFICEPDLITRLINGQDKSKCLSCSKCFFVPDKRCILH
jgi:2,4-dienoyl-CoA reductase-like NADH-dependent reductase (Old Yellow Enzyme family)